MCPQAVKFARKNSKNRNWENVFNGGATTSGRMDKQMPTLDSARQSGPESISHELKIGKVAGCFSQRSRNQQPWDKMEDTAGLGIVLPTLFE